MPIDYGALRGEVGTPDIPDDGDHIAYLDRAALVDTANGERLVTEWRDVFKPLIQWTSWNRFDSTGMSYTRDLLAGLGVDLSTVTEDDELIRELSVAQGGAYRVRTTSQMGSRGDRVFISTYVDGTAKGNDLQPELPMEGDVPIDTSGLPEPSTNAEWMGDESQPAAPAEVPVPWEDDTPPF
jgi:hypothetical protein